MTGVLGAPYRTAGVGALFAVLAFVGAVVDLSFQVLTPVTARKLSTYWLLVGLIPSHCCFYGHDKKTVTPDGRYVARYLHQHHASSRRSPDAQFSSSCIFYFHPHRKPWSDIAHGFFTTRASAAAIDGHNLPCLGVLRLLWKGPMRMEESLGYLPSFTAPGLSCADLFRLLHGFSLRTGLSISTGNGQFRYSAF